MQKALVERGGLSWNRGEREGQKKEKKRIKGRNLVLQEGG